MATETLEERVTRLEVEIARLKERQNDRGVARPGVIGRTSPDFIDRVFGIFADSPNFEEVQRGIEAEREREREEARRLEEEDD